MRADYIIKNAFVYQTFRQCFEKRDVAVLGDRFYEVMPELPDFGDGGGSADTQPLIIDGTGKYMIPGFLDIHMHIESSMTYPQEFSRIAIQHGTTTVVADAHEIANVFGMEGLEAFSNQDTELDIFYAIPSSVPATDVSLETPGAVIGEAEVEKLLEDDRVLCLGEVMNFKNLVPEDDRDTQIRRMIRMCLEKRGREIRLEGHCPKISGRDLNHFIFAGVDADHTQQTPESVLEKTDLGMFLELQLKSLTPGVVDAVCRHQLYENVALVTDDTMPDQLLTGQMNRIVKTAAAAGMPVEKAIYCATYTPARRMHLDDRGMIGPGKLADFMLLDDLESFHPAAVFKNGRLAACREELEKRCPEAEELSVKAPETRKSGEKERIHQQTAADKKADKFKFPPHFYRSVRCRKAEASDFVLRTEKPCTSVLANVMKISTFGTATTQVKRRIPVRDGIICWEEAGLCLAVLYERYGKNGNIGYGLVEGAFGSGDLEAAGAAATTWCHDSHNLLVLGNSPEDMLAAQRRVVELQGGYVVSSGGRVTAEAALPVGGIISDGPLEKLAADLGQVRTAMKKLGYVNNNEIMSMSTLALPVSPSLKLTDYGLLDVKTQERVELIAEYLQER
ncbi:MAG: adenine deaminase C-terminal domain-containing protein [Lachnospiraceae bacterium]|nr:adenine deaminase C-terminal domain-containing protein [Lachnospiraceae bacterium]